MSYDLVIFDCDGVLVDTERIAVAVESRMLTEMGWPLTPDDIVARFVGRSTKAMLDAVAAELGAEAAQRFDEESHAETRRAFATDLRAVDGVADVVEALRLAAVPTCVASSGSHDKMRLTLGVTGLWDTFEGRIVSVDDVANGKPAPDLFLHAAATMGVDPTRCAVIEDSEPGVHAAIAAGMTPYGFTGGLAADGVLAAAGAIPFAEMAELAALLLPVG